MILCRMKNKIQIHQNKPLLILKGTSPLLPLLGVAVISHLVATRCFPREKRQDNGRRRDLWPRLMSTPKPHGHIDEKAPNLLGEKTGLLSISLASEREVSTRFRLAQIFKLSWLPV